MTTPVKICTKCNITYTADTTEGLTKYFYKSGKNDGKLRTVCKCCLNKKSKRNTPKDNNIIVDSNRVFTKKCTKCNEGYNCNTLDGFSKYFSYLDKDNKVFNNICKHCKSKFHYNKYTLDELFELQTKLEKKLKLINEVISERTKSK